MTYEKRTQTKPISIRLTTEERLVLTKAAGKRTLSEFIRERLLGDQTQSRQVRNPKHDVRLLAQLLARLGQSELGASLRAMSRDVKAGAMPLTPETEKTVHAAAAAVIEMRDHLMRALGLVERIPE